MLVTAQLKTRRPFDLKRLQHLGEVPSRSPFGKSLREVPSESPFEKSLREVPSEIVAQKKNRHSEEVPIRTRFARSARATAPRAAVRGGRPRSLRVGLARTPRSVTSQTSTLRTIQTHGGSDLQVRVVWAVVENLFFFISSAGFSVLPGEVCRSYSINCSERKHRAKDFWRIRCRLSFQALIYNRQ